MKQFNKDSRGFHWHKKAWYTGSFINRDQEIAFGVYPNENNSDYAEMNMVWIELRAKQRIAPRLECFNDAFRLLPSFTDLIEELDKLDSTYFTQEQFVEVLKKCGFKDLTSYQRKSD